VADVFLSYKRENLAEAARLCERLRAANLDVWWDRDIPAAAPWEASIEKALGEARVVLVCWSRAAVASENVKSEARWARERGRLIQIFVEPCDPPLFFGERQGVDLTGWSGDRADPRFKQVVTAIRERLQSAALSPAVDDPARPPKSSTVPGRSTRRRRWWLATAAIALLLVAGAALWAFRGGRGDDRSLIAVEEFPASGAGVPSGFTAGLHEQMVTTRDDSEGIKVRDAKAFHGRGWRLTGRVTADAALVRIYAQFYQPGSDDPIWSTRYEAPPTVSPVGFGRELMQVALCIVEGDNERGGLAPNVLSAWSHYCGLTFTSGSDDAEIADAARRVTAADPHFKYGLAALAVVLAQEADHTTGAEAARLRQEGEQAARAILRLDPRYQDAWLALALLSPPTALASKEAMYRQAIALPGKDPGSAHGTYGYFLQGVGRNQAAGQEFRRAIDLDPDDADLPTYLAETESESGKFGEADNILGVEVASRRNPSQAAALRLWNALRARDWPTARKALSVLPASPRREADRAMVDALASGSKARIETALAAVRVGRNDGPGALDICAIFLALAGHDAEALSLIEGYPNPGVRGLLFGPPFEATRRLPAFATLVQQMGLMDYWRQSRQPPDFCKLDGPPAFCAQL
jgi:tetratricopeptide (TPR) repeat protein